MFDLQGHRGCRGLMPENTIEGFIYAIQLGVHTLEMDTVISKDKQVIVSHEPYMSHEICTQANESPITAENEKQFNLYEMTWEEIQKFDCGLKPHPRFPLQKKQQAYKPLLAEVVREVERFAKKMNRQAPVFYNIETKCKPETDLIFHPHPEEFAQLLFEVVEETGIADQTMIQSFDVRTLQWLKKNDKKVALSLLVEPANEITPEGNSFDFRKKIDELGFIPTIYSPFYKLVTPELITFANKNQMQVIPWTVNDLATCQTLKKLGVHGLITDYPDRVF